MRANRALTSQNPTPVLLMQGKNMDHHPRILVSAARLGTISRRAAITVVTATAAAIALCLLIAAAQHTGRGSVYRRSRRPARAHARSPHGSLAEIPPAG